MSSGNIAIMAQLVGLPARAPGYGSAWQPTGVPKGPTALCWYLQRDRPQRLILKANMEEPGPSVEIDFESKFGRARTVRRD